MQITISRADREQLKAIAVEYECDARALVEIAIEELIAAHQKPRAPEVQKRTAKPAPAPSKSTGRSYTEKACVDCRTLFQPSGPRATRCGQCRAGGEAIRTNPNAPEVVWNGAMGRNGTSLTGNLR